MNQLVHFTLTVADWLTQFGKSRGEMQLIHTVQVKNTLKTPKALLINKTAKCQFYFVIQRSSSNCIL